MADREATAAPSPSPSPSPNASANASASASASPSFAGAGVRLAGPADSQALCELFRATPMEGDLALAVERDPDFFALYDLQEVERLVYLAERCGRVEGLCAFLGRQGYVDGRPARVGYAGDLRLAPGLRGGFFLARHFPTVFAEACRALGCEAMLTAIIASNQAARRALVERSPRHPKKPLYSLLARFSILSIFLTGRRRRRRTAFRVARAREGDLPEIAALLERDHRARPFGYVLDEAVLRQRLARWPGLRPESFYLARDGQGRLSGVVAPWDAHAVKRFRVLGYRGGMRWVRRGMDLAARLLGFEPLPAPGGLFRYAYLTHASVPGEDPEVMAALLEAVYADLLAERYHFISACALDGDPLWPAYRRFWTTPLGAELYLVTDPGSPLARTSLAGARPGFEMALV